MGKSVRVILMLWVLQLVCSPGIIAQTLGDYGSANPGPASWNNAGSWVIFQTTGDWSDATPAVVIPGATDAVWIRSGHVIRVRGGHQACNDINVSGELRFDALNPWNLTVNGNLFGGGLINCTGVINQTLLLNGDVNFTGTLNASTSLTVNYNSAGDQDVFSSTGYYHITFSNNGTKYLQGNITVDGNLTIQNSARLFTQNNPVTLLGNWINQGVTADPFEEGTGTVIFSGSGNQNITSNIGEETFHDLEISKSGGSVILQDNVAISNDFILSGVVSAGSNTLRMTKETGVLTYSSGRIIGKFKRKLENTGGNSYLFPSRFSLQL